MKLIDFQIKNYKVIDDTRPIRVDPRVTAFVGKNESGKTAVLKALWKTHNVADATFDKLYDYPRDRYCEGPEEYPGGHGSEVRTVPGGSRMASSQASRSRWSASRSS